MKKSILMLIISTFVFGLLILGATLAWFTDNGEAVNTFVAGDVAITLHDLLEDEDFPEDGIPDIVPGGEYAKKVYVSSEGSIDTYVRIQLTPKWDPESVGEGEDLVVLDTGIVDLNLDLENWVFINGWYYYKDILSTGDETTLLLDGLSFNVQMDSLYANAVFTLEAKAEGIQATNNAIVEEWGVNPADWEDTGL